MIERLASAAGRAVSRETFGALQRYVDLLKTGNLEQNLVSSATLDQVWERHILDSAQLVRFEPRAGASWVDIGSGAGLPGLIVGALVPGPLVLVEPRRLRAEFLARAANAMDLGDRVTVVQARAERAVGQFDVITARAVAPLARLLEISAHLSTGKTRWVLPKGQSAESELAEAKRSWQGVFHVEPSLTNPESRIVIASEIGRK